MARVLHVEDDPEIRKLVADIFAMTNYELSQFDSVESAERSGGGYDLYICGTMGKHSDGLIFALTQGSGVIESLSLLTSRSSRGCRSLPRQG